MCDTNQYFFKTGGVVSLTVVNGLTGISEVTNINSVYIYPNPSTNIFAVKINSTLIGAQYSITDIEGREVIKGILRNEINTVPAYNLAPGIYLLHVGLDGRNTSKLVKQ